MSREDSTLILASVLVAGLAGVARADRIIANGRVPFEFTVGSTKVPAGRYEILVPGNDEHSLVVRNVDSGQTTSVEYLTRLAPRDDGKATVAWAIFVFDESGGERVLSEIHLTLLGGVAARRGARQGHAPPRRADHPRPAATPHAISPELVKKLLAGSPRASPRMSTSTCARRGRTSPRPRARSSVSPSRGRVGECRPQPRSSG